MENNLQVFTNEEFGNVRIVIKDGVICFVAVDCCNALGIKNVSQALESFDDDEKAEVSIGYISSNGVEQRRNVLAVTEAGLYRLIFMSRKPNAKKFQRWIFHEVLPAIRNNGYYALPGNIPAVITPDFLRQIADAIDAKNAQITALEKTVGIQEMKIAELEPKACYYDVVLNSKSLVKVSTIAQDYGMSAKAFNKLLHSLGVQYRQGGIWLLYQKYAQLGWAATKSYHFTDKNGDDYSREYLCWTQKGRLGLYELLKCNGYLPLIERLYPPRESTPQLDDEIIDWSADD